MSVTSLKWLWIYLDWIIQAEKLIPFMWRVNMQQKRSLLQNYPFCVLLSRILIPTLVTLNMLTLTARDKQFYTIDLAPSQLIKGKVQIR